MDAYISFWKHYFDFNGTATRMEYWVAVIGNFIIGFVFAVATGLSGWLAVSPLDVNQAPSLALGILTLFSLMAVIPYVSLVVRRVRDTGISNVAIWSIVAILFTIVSYVFGVFKTDAFNK
jgi:uncharacterized membrane protein YhaH (DUF805 family)